MSRSTSIVTCEPHTIWQLGDNERPVAVIGLVQECARQFSNAVQRTDSGAAQDYAIAALTAFGGLFPDLNDDAHKLLSSLTGMLVDAKTGRTKHILLRTSKPIRGAWRSSAHAYVAGFALSAVEVFTTRRLASVRSARIQVAQLLADQGYSLRVGDHQMPKPISASAIRNWSENPDIHGLPHAIAADMAPIHAINLDQRSAKGKAEVIDYLRKQATAAVQHAKGL